MKSLKFVALSLCAVTAAASQSISAQGLVKVDGSSTAYPITEAVAEDFQRARRGTRVTVGVSGTGGGFKKLCRGEIDIAGASRPILLKEMEECRAAGIKYVELPVAFDAITVVVNPKNPLTKISVQDLKKMWEPAAQGQLKAWNQVNPAFPNQALKLFAPGADSGTFDYFSEAVVGKAKSSRGDYTASEDDNVLVQGVSRDVGALGYFGYAYYLENKAKLKALAIEAAPGKPAVLPSLESVMSGAYQPLSRPVFIYVSAKSMDRPEVKAFVEYYLKEGAELVKEVKYVPLPAEEYKMALDNFHKRKTGTAFGGHPDVGVKIADLLKRQPKE